MHDMMNQIMNQCDQGNNGKSQHGRCNTDHHLILTVMSGRKVNLPFLGNPCNQQQNARRQDGFHNPRKPFGRQMNGCRSQNANEKESNRSSHLPEILSELVKLCR